MTRLRLMLVADDPLSASSLRHALRATGAFDIVDGYVDGRGPCAVAVRAHRPDVVVIDHMAARQLALARIAELRAELPAAKLVMLASPMDPVWASEAASAGADAAIARTIRLDGVSALVREVVAGNVFHAFDVPRAAPRAAADIGFPALTDRELEVLRLVAAGASNGRIAAQLWITEQTVKFHLSNVYRKLGVSNRTEASHHAYVHGLLRFSSRAGVAA
jgi:DNA-binding NarL/FixJ family response regulator